jgi:ABC-2 type transport system ATP-binding protein
LKNEPCPVQNLNPHFTDLERNFPSTNAVYEFFALLKGCPILKGKLFSVAHRGGKSMVELYNVAKTYVVRERAGLFRPSRRREIPALQGIDLQVQPGEFVGLLGPNGAGKTTLLKIVATLLLPTRGEVFVKGIDALKYPTKVRRLLGVVLAGERTLYWKLTARENLLLFAGLHNIPGKEARRRADELLSLVGLKEFANVTVEKFSTGMRKRLAIARALIHAPEILILDEPTSGLDPHGVAEVWNVLLALREQGKTVLMATHNMLEAERIPTRLLIIDSGRILADGTAAEIVAKSGAKSVALLTLDAKPSLAKSLSLRANEDGTWLISVPLEELPVHLSTIQGQGRRILNVEIRESRLWEAFLRLTGRPFDDLSGPNEEEEE